MAEIGKRLLDCDDREGERGERGKRGERGHRGHRGERGERGHRGHRGPTGPTGSTGSTGPTGMTGVTGTTGPTGSTGATGPSPILAVAHVAADGTFISQNGFASSAIIGGPVYILTLATAPPPGSIIPVVSVTGVAAIIEPRVVTNQVQVRIVQLPNTLINAEFYVIVALGP